MELILINDIKLKIMLSPEDMISYDLNNSNIDYKNTETRRAFWNILDEAKHKTGFDAASDRVYIQYYPIKNGGCEMYITKLTDTCEAATSHNSSCETAFSFNSSELLFRVCRQLRSRNINGASYAYKDDSGVCYLFLSSAYSHSFVLDFISEFGDECDPETLHAYADEHCTVLCRENAVETLGKLI